MSVVLLAGLNETSWAEVRRFISLQAVYLVEEFHSFKHHPPRALVASRGQFRAPPPTLESCKNSKYKLQSPTRCDLSPRFKTNQKCSLCSCEGLQSGRRCVWKCVDVCRPRRRCAKTQHLCDKRGPLTTRDSHGGENMSVSKDRM